MKVHALRVAFGLIFFMGVASHPASASTPLTLRDAIELALKKSPTFDSAKQSAEVATLQHQNAFAKLLPSIDFTTTDGLQNDIPISSDNSLLLTTNPVAPWYSTLTLGLTETLYDNGASLTGLDIAKLNEDAALLTALKTRDQLVLAVANQFYDYSLNQILVSVRKKQLELLNHQFEILSSQYQQGFKIRADYLRLKTQVMQAELDRVSGDESLEQSLTKLEQTLGVVGQEGYEFTPTEVSLNEKFEELKGVTDPNLEGFYDLKLAEIQDEIGKKNVNLAMRNYYPQVSVAGGVSYNNMNFINSPNSFNSNNQISWNALLTVSYNLWDWGILKHSVQIAERNHDIQNDASTQNVQQVRSDLGVLMATAKRAYQKFALNHDLLDSQEESNRLVEAQYREGKVTYLDLITSLTGLLSARIQFYTAYFENLKSLAAYRYYEGKIYGSLAEK